jgi:hypothetical protein
MVSATGVCSRCVGTGTGRNERPTDPACSTTDR